MARKMLINALHAEEARVAIVEDGRLVDLDVEIAGSEQTRGNIYRGVVVRVEPGLQAAFVDVGLKKLGFLQMGEIHPENYKWRDDIPEEQRHRRPRIQEILRRGQELLVQVEKGERDNKGSALTSYISLPGRYMVLMPGSDSAGISRKVESESERKKLKEIISEMNIPNGYGYIIRTEAMGRTRDELQKDLDSLISLYEGVKAQGTAGKGAGLIYQESALIIRTIRDYFSADIDEVLVDSKDVFKDVREALKEIDPQFEKLVKMHQEKRPIFSRYQLEEQIDLIYEKKVPLKSGGSIFIEPTEALVSIDVNSGKSTGEKGVEDTAFKTNLEAAEEAARQLRLRDLGGLIVIDFIDMRERKHNIEVEKALKSALKADKARVNVSRISEFGLLEMSRQRIRQTLHQASTLECPHCDGRGKVKSVEAMALSFLRKVHAAAAKGTVAEVLGSLPLEVAYYLLNRKRQELSRIESDYDIEVTVKGKPSYLLNQMELELVKREKLHPEEIPQEKGAARPSKEEGAPQEAAAAEGRKKRKKKGKGHAEEAAAAAEAVHETAPAPEAAPAAPEALVQEQAMASAEPFTAETVPVALVVEPGGAERVVLAEGEHEEQKKKRRRKRRRGKGGAAEAAAAHPAEVAIDLPAAASGLLPPEAAQEAAPEAGMAAAEQAGEQPGEEVKKKRRRKRRRGKGHEAAAQEGAAGTVEQPGALVQEAVPAAAAAMPEQATVVTEAPQAATVEAVPVTGEAEPAPAAGKTAKSRRPARKKEAAEPAVAEVEQLAAAAPAKIVEAVEAPRPKRGRGKKPAAEGAAVGTAGADQTIEAGRAFPVAEAVEVTAVSEPVPLAGETTAGKARRKAPAKAAPATAAPATAATAAPAKAATPAKAARGAKAKAAPATAAEVAPAAEAPAQVKQGPVAGEPAAATAETAPVEAKAKPKRQPRSKAKPAAEQATAPQGGNEQAPAAAAEAPAQPAPEAPKKKRAPRKKKEETGP
ncbi:MAG TPA: Rne/Rng family ribonuclease [Geomonas sp.]|nr:Rne/Rng family ribonuclease [Geomonas sp.]